MSREGVEIISSTRYIATSVYHALTAIYHHHSTYGVGYADNWFQIWASSESIRCLGNCHKARALIN